MASAPDRFQREVSVPSAFVVFVVATTALTWFVLEWTVLWFVALFVYFGLGGPRFVRSVNPKLQWAILAAIVVSFHAALFLHVHFR